jgi:hypothetical protein
MVRGCMCIAKAEARMARPEGEERSVWATEKMEGGGKIGKEGR